MAKKKATTSSRALEGPRVLSKAIEALSSTYTTEWSSDSGWISEGTSLSIMNESYFDLSANELDDLTFAPSGGGLQDPGQYKSSNPTLAIAVMDIISQDKLTLADIETNIIANNAPGMPESKQDFTQIIMGNYRLMCPNLQLLPTLLQTISGGSFGSGEATAASRLWIYRVVTVVSGVLAPGDTLNVPAARFILPGVVMKEGDLSYMMRLKRSFELATGP